MHSLVTLLFYIYTITSIGHSVVYDNTIGSDEWLQMPQFGPKDFCQLGAIDYIFNYNHKVCVTYRNSMWTYDQIIAGQTDQPLNQEKTFDSYEFISERLDSNGEIVTNPEDMPWNIS
ncbi:unnamed protein product, partial [Oppiella nova]